MEAVSDSAAALRAVVRHTELFIDSLATHDLGPVYTGAHAYRHKDSLARSKHTDVKPGNLASPRGCGMLFVNITP